MSLAQRAMQHPLLAPVYERAWRPMWWLAAMGFDLPHLLRERQHAVEALRLSPGQSVLDVACGPGNFTDASAAAVGPDGLAVGVDLSRPMIERAVAAHSGPAYLLGSATRLPFRDRSFDAVACYGALYLIPEPFAALDEIIRVVRPGGRVALMASEAPGWLPAGATAAVERAVGLRALAADDLTGRLVRAGFGEVTHERHGLFQYVAGTAPHAG